MQDKDEKVIERVFDDALERVWEEARLRDLMTLCYMWKNGEMGQYDSFYNLLTCFNQFDSMVRNMKEKEYFALEKDVVETICNSSDGQLSGTWTEEEI